MRCQRFWSYLAGCPDGGWHGEGAQGSGIPGQPVRPDCRRKGTADALAAPELETKVVFGIFVTAASHGNGSCEMTGIALISVSSCWGYWESIFCFGNIMFGFPKQNFEGFLFYENFKCWLTSWFKGVFFLKTQKACNKNSDFQPALFTLQLEDYFSFFYMLLVRNFTTSTLFAFVFLSSLQWLLVSQCAASIFLCLIPFHYCIAQPSNNLTAFLFTPLTSTNDDSFQSVCS